MAHDAEIGAAVASDSEGFMRFLESKIVIHYIITTGEPPANSNVLLEDKNCETSCEFHAASASALGTQDRPRSGIFWEPMDIQHVARVAKVSTATVSRVLNASPKVKPSTVERVKKVIDELHYVPNTSAQICAWAAASYSG
jgi:hypothetical protein